MLLHVKLHSTIHMLEYEEKELKKLHFQIIQFFLIMEFYLLNLIKKGNKYFHKFSKNL